MVHGEGRDPSTSGAEAPVLCAELPVREMVHGEGRDPPTSGAEAPVLCSELPVHEMVPGGRLRDTGRSPPPT